MQAHNKLSRALSLLSGTAGSFCFDHGDGREVGVQAPREPAIPGQVMRLRSEPTDLKVNNFKARPDMHAVIGRMSGPGLFSVQSGLFDWLLNTGLLDQPATATQSQSQQTCTQQDQRSGLSNTIRAV